ncbi:MAG: hypothetical protein ACK4WD_09635 [Flavobacteriales bacterium]
MKSFIIGILVLSILHVQSQSELDSLSTFIEKWSSRSLCEADLIDSSGFIFFKYFEVLDELNDSISRFSEKKGLVYLYNLAYHSLERNSFWGNRLLGPDERQSCIIAWSIKYCGFNKDPNIELMIYQSDILSELCKKDGALNKTKEFKKMRRRIIRASDWYWKQFDLDDRPISKD